MKQPDKRLLMAASVLVCACYLTVFCLINFRGFARFCTPDMYSDTYLSRVMWESGTIFPENWVFGNQFYVVTTPVLAAVFYGLCGSINLAMALATTVMTLLTLLSFWWMVRPFADRGQILLGMAVLLGCVIGPEIVTTIEGQIFYLMASYYAGYLITLFVVFGDYVHTRTGVSRNGTFALMLAAALSFCTGMQSLRQTAVMILPLLAVEALRLLGVCLRRRHTAVDWNWPLTGRVAVYTLANLAGRAAIAILNPACITMYGKLSFNSPEQIPGCLNTCLRALRSITGLKYLESETPLVGIAALVLVLAAASAVFLTVRSSAKAAPDGKSMLMLLCGCSVLCVLGVSVVINIYTRSIYIFTWYPMAALAAMVLADRCRGWRKNAVCSLLLAAMLGNLFLSYGSTAQEALSDDTPPQQQIAQYLMDEGYTRLYGPWTQIAGIAVWTDGQVAAGSWSNQVCQILPYINPVDIYTEADNARACYLVTQGAVEQAFLEHAAQAGAALTLQTRFDGTYYAIYTSDCQLMYFETP